MLIWLWLHIHCIFNLLHSQPQSRFKALLGRSCGHMWSLHVTRASTPQAPNIPCLFKLQTKDWIWWWVLEYLLQHSAHLRVRCTEWWVHIAQEKRLSNGVPACGAEDLHLIKFFKFSCHFDVLWQLDAIGISLQQQKIRNTLLLRNRLPGLLVLLHRKNISFAKYRMHVHGTS